MRHADVIMVKLVLKHGRMSALCVCDTQHCETETGCDMCETCVRHDVIMVKLQRCLCVIHNTERQRLGETCVRHV